MKPLPFAESSYAEAERAAECATMARRAVPGGAYYLLGWAIIGSYGHAFDTHPLWATAISFVFVALAAARLWLSRHVPSDFVRQRTHLSLWWCVVVATAAAWSGVSWWVYFDEDFDDAHTVALLCTMAFASAMTSVYAMRWQLALSAAALLFLPAIAWAVTRPDYGAVVVLGAFLLYLTGSLFACHRDHLEQTAWRRELAAQRDRYAGLAHTDSLTRLPNRLVFKWTLEEAFAADTEASLLIVDIDHFKRINDTHGHAAGDACLVAFAQLLRDAVAGHDALVARLGGEEFGIVLAGVAQPAANRVALAIKRQLHAATDPALLSVTASIGVGSRRAQYRRHEEWFVEVDRALYHAKGNGRDRVCCVCSSLAA